ncbi:MAG: tyrosine-type recombinase/integrase [Steroidobacteraceae bacterium]
MPDRLMEALPKQLKTIFEFALATGCRAGEILGLEWSRVDLDRKVAWLDHGTTKSGDGRSSLACAPDSRPPGS